MALLKRSQEQERAFPYEVELLGLQIRVHEGVFSPKYFEGWRTFTLNLPDVEGLDFLEIGCGTGITSLWAKKCGARRVVALDICEAAVNNTKANAKMNGLEIEVLRSDVFDELGPSRFDVIYWNLPFIWVPLEYCVKSELERSLVDPGYRDAERFLKGAPQFLRPGGRILGGLGDFGNLILFHEIAARYGYSWRKIADAAAWEGQRVHFVLYELHQTT